MAVSEKKRKVSRARVSTREASDPLSDGLPEIRRKDRKASQGVDGGLAQALWNCLAGNAGHRELDAERLADWVGRVASDIASGVTAGVVDSPSDAEVRAKTRAWLIEGKGLDKIRDPKIIFWLRSRQIDADGDLADLNASEVGAFEGTIEAADMDMIAQAVWRGRVSKGQRIRRAQHLSDLRRRLADGGLRVPDDFAELSENEADALVGAADDMAVETEVKETFRAEIDDAQNRRAVASVGQKMAEMAQASLAKLGNVAAELQSALLRGDLEPAAVPRAVKARVREIFGEGHGPRVNVDEGLTAMTRIAELEAEIRNLRAASLGRPAEVLALEAEVAAMLTAGKPPELYTGRADRKETPFEFLGRVYGRYLETGREAIYLHEIRKVDPKFVRSLEMACLKKGQKISEYVRMKKNKTDERLATVGREVPIDELGKLAEAYRSRRRRRKAGAPSS